MHLKYFNIGLLFALVVSSVWLFLRAAPKQESAKMLSVLARACAVGAWLVILSYVALFYFSFPLLGSATDKLLYERNSPNGLYAAAVFNRYGGATVHNTTRVSIRANGEKLDTKKNAIVFSEDAVPSLNVVWEGDRHLVIRNEQTEIYQQLTNWHEVNITYLHGPSN